MDAQAVRRLAGNRDQVLRFAAQAVFRAEQCDESARVGEKLPGGGERWQGGRRRGVREQADALAAEAGEVVVPHGVEAGGVAHRGLAPFTYWSNHASCSAKTWPIDSRAA